MVEIPHIVPRSEKYLLDKTKVKPCGICDEIFRRDADEALQIFFTLKLKYLRMEHEAYGLVIDTFSDQEKVGAFLSAEQEVFGSAGRVVLRTRMVNFRYVVATIAHPTLCEADVVGVLVIAVKHILPNLSKDL